MKIQPFVLLLAVITPVYFIFAPKAAHIPTDLRDAVGGGAFDALPGSASDVNVPVVSAAEAGDKKSGRKAIYGADDRLDYYESDAVMKGLADSVVSLWSAKNVKISDDKAELRVMPFGMSLNLCPGHKFAEQPIGSSCSGTLVGEDVVMTAGHCVPDASTCADTRFVFGYALKSAGEYPMSVPAGEVYSCNSIIKQDLDTDPGFFSSVFNGGPGPDFALIKLDRKVTGHKPLPIHKKAKPAAGDKLFIIGHPLGLPLKVAGGAKVRDVSPKYFFRADLDAFSGNSGSAVFNADTNLIEGILVRGPGDFAMHLPAVCLEANVVPQDGGRGVAVNKISVVEKYLPK